MHKRGEDEHAMVLNDTKPKPSMPARFRDLPDASRLSPQQQSSRTPTLATPVPAHVLILTFFTWGNQWVEREEAAQHPD
ncbi:hypothetical protein FRC09_009985 [Ceratobasidium sp. 395]|nr:hypothetical protein FRC09_009985 [Ceratobasidium sp. 395]